MNDKDTLARTLYGEAEPKDEADAIAIAWVVRNRAEHKLWPDTIAEVCLQHSKGGVYQFSCWSPKHGNPEKLEKVTAADKWFARCLEIAGQVIAGKIEDPTNRSTHYYADYIAAPKWARGKTPVYQTPWGKYNHLFFNDIDTAPPPPKPPARTAIESAVAAGTPVVAAAAGLDWEVVLILVVAALAVGWFLWRQHQRSGA